jgi:soluble lytic murein transglycosylase-like protein
MLAKSAPQLSVGSKYSVTARQPRTLLLLSVGVVLAGVAWLQQSQSQKTTSALNPGKAAEPSPIAVVGDAKPVENNRVRILADFLAKRYKVSQAVTLDLVTIAHTAGRQMGLDPLLIIAVMAIESRFNPIAESGMGAKGLMQVIPKYHLEKFRTFGGEQYAVFDPATNILVGAKILKDYMAHTGSISGALQRYVGSSSAQEDPYIGKVMGEKQRLQQVLGVAIDRPVEASSGVKRDAEALSTRTGETKPLTTGTPDVEVVETVLVSALH